jgi:predicted nucleic acid-binding protein
MAIVIDASVAIKWVLEEAGSSEARDLALTETLIAPDFLFVECANVLWTKARRNLLSKADAGAKLAAIEAVSIRAVSGPRHAAAAMAIAFELDQTAYDSLYLAVALAERSILVTADARFFQTAAAHPVYRASVKSLGAAASG